MNIEVVIIFYHEQMTLGDAIFASTIVVVIGLVAAVFINKLLTLNTED